MRLAPRREMLDCKTRPNSLFQVYVVVLQE
jgi:hypothetical protein